MNNDPTKSLPNFEADSHRMHEQLVGGKEYDIQADSRGFESALIHIGDHTIALHEWGSRTQLMRAGEDGSNSIRFVLTNVETSERLEVRQDEITLGRGYLGLDDGFVSRKHVTIGSKQESPTEMLTMFVKDEDSTNGTKLTTDREAIDSIVNPPRDPQEIAAENQAREAARIAAAQAFAQSMAAYRNGQQPR